MCITAVAAAVAVMVYVVVCVIACAVPASVAIGVAAIALEVVAAGVAMVTRSGIVSAAYATACVVSARTATWATIATAAWIGVTHHVVVHSTKSAVPHRATIEIEAACVIEASVAAAIVPEDAGTIVEVIVVGIVAIDGEVPSATEPHDGTEEVACCCKSSPLPVVENVAEVIVAVAEIASVCEVSLGVERKQIVEVDFEGVVVLLVVEVELIRHFVCEIVSTLACGLIIHCIHRHRGEECECQSKEILFHSRTF